MPFPKNPVDLQVYVSGNNYFVFKTGKGWTRLESDVFFKQSTQPTLQDLKGRNSVWQDTSTNLFSFWNAADGWITTTSTCSAKIPNPPKSMIFYCPPNIDSLLRDPLVLSNKSWFSENNIVNARIPSDYNIQINGPSPDPSITEINYFVLFLDAYGNPISLPSIPAITASWSKTNPLTKSPVLSTTVYKATDNPKFQKSDSNDWYSYAYGIKLKVDTSLYGYELNTTQSRTMDYSFNTPLNIEFLATNYNLKLTNTIASAHYDFKAITGSVNEIKNEYIKPYMKFLYYPQFHQIQKNGSAFTVPITIALTTGHTNIFDSSGNFTNKSVPVPSDGIAETTYTYGWVGGPRFVDVSIKSIGGVSGTPTYSLSGTQHKSLSNGMVVFESLGFSVSNFSLTSETPYMVLEFTCNDTSVASKTIVVNWI